MYASICFEMILKIYKAFLKRIFYCILKNGSFISKGAFENLDRVLFDVWFKKYKHVFRKKCMSGQFHNIIKDFAQISIICSQTALCYQLLLLNYFTTAHFKRRLIGHYEKLLYNSVIEIMILRPFTYQASLIAYIWLL